MMIHFNWATHLFHVLSKKSSDLLISFSIAKIALLSSTLLGIQQNLHLPLILSSHQITAQGITMTTNKKFIGIKNPEKTPKDLIGMIGLNKLAKKAAAVVLDVIDMALEALLNE